MKMVQRVAYAVAWLRSCMVSAPSICSTFTRQLVPGAGLSMLVELKDFGFVRRDRVADEPAA